MKYKVGDKVRVRIDLEPYEVYGNLTFLGGNMSKCAGQICTIKEVLGDKKYYVSENPFAWSEEMLESADSKTSRMADGTIIGEFAKEGIIGKFKGIPVYATGGTVSIHDLDIASLYRPMNIDVQPLELVCNEEKAKEIAERLNKELARHFNAFSKYTKGTKAGNIYFDEWTFKEEKKMPTKFTFYVTEGARIDKSCNKTVPTMTTFVSIGRYHSGKATCDKVDYDERQGCLEAIANAFLDGNFDREFNKAVKKNERTELHNRTCTYCGKVFDTVDELKEYEAWHVERKKARRERYLLRKRAKEIAFEEAAQKMAKEMIKEDK